MFYFIVYQPDILKVLSKYMVAIDMPVNIVTMKQEFVMYKMEFWQCNVQL